MDIEDYVAQSASAGGWCDVDQLIGDNPALSRSVGGEFLHDLSSGRDVHPRGVRIRGARVTGMLLVDWETLTVPLIFERCVFDQPISLIRAHSKSLVFHRCVIPELTLERILADGDLVLSRSVVDGAVNLRGADVHGDLLLESTRLSASPIALDGRLLTVRGDAVLREVLAEGKITLRGARVDGDALLNQMVVMSADDALDAERLSVGGTLVLERSRFTGGVRLTGAKLNALNLREITATARENAAIRIDGATVTGAVLLDAAVIEGGLSIDGATLGGLLGSEVRFAGLSGLGATVVGDLMLTDVLLDGDVTMAGATVNGRLEVKTRDEIGPPPHLTNLRTVPGDTLSGSGRAGGTASGRSCCSRVPRRCPFAPATLRGPLAR